MNDLVPTVMVYTTVGTVLTEATYPYPLTRDGIIYPDIKVSRWQNGELIGEDGKSYKAFENRFLIFTVDQRMDKYIARLWCGVPYAAKIKMDLGIWA